MKKIIFTLVVICTSMLMLAQTDYQRVKVKPLNGEEIKKSYALQNDEDKYMTSQLIEFIPITNQDITNDFLGEIATVVESANSLKLKVNDSRELETLNKSIFQLKNLQYNMVSLDEIAYYNAVMKHTNYSNIVTIDTLTIKLEIAYYGVTGGYEKNRLKWLRSYHNRQDIINSIHGKERAKFKDICVDVERIQQNENIKELRKTNEVQNVIYDMETVEIKPEFIGGQKSFYEFIGNHIERPSSFEDFPLGKIKASFIVEKNGSLTNIKITKDVGGNAGEQLDDVLRESPNWIPGEQNGEKVRVLYLLSIKLRSYNPKDYYHLGFREAISLPQPKNDCKEEGIVNVKITVDSSGKVIEAIPYGGINNVSECLLEEAKVAALNSTFDNTTEKLKNDRNMSEQERYFRNNNRRKQAGEMYYRFEN